MKRTAAILFYCFFLSTSHSQTVMSFDQTIKMAQQSAENNQPEHALILFQRAFSSAKNNEVRKRIALFGMGKMQLWLEDYSASEQSNEQLLQMNLNEEDNQIALDGYVRSVSAQDQPIKAFLFIPAHFTYKTASGVVGASQAALWAGWHYKAKKLLHEHAELLKIIKPNNHLCRQLNDVSWQVNSATEKNAVNFSMHIESDSEKFLMQRRQFNYAHHFNSTFNVSLFINNNRYSAPTFSDVNAWTIAAQSEGWITDFHYYQANIAHGNINGWHPSLWKTQLNFTPNDFISFHARNDKEAVESMPSFMHHITQNTLEFGIKIHPVYRLKLTANGSYSRFSDDVRRPGYYAEASYLLLPQLGLHTEALVRGYSNSSRSANYFSPQNYMEERIMLRLFRRLGNTNARYYVLLGLGRQNINNSAFTPTRNYKLGFTAPITNHFTIEGSSGYSTSAGDNALQTTDYVAKFTEISLNYAFN